MIIRIGAIWATLKEGDVLNTNSVRVQGIAVTVIAAPRINRCFRVTAFFDVSPQWMSRPILISKKLEKYML